jgi:hypothetical protein
MALAAHIYIRKYYSLIWTHRINTHQINGARCVPAVLLCTRFIISYDNSNECMVVLNSEKCLS